MTSSSVWVAKARRGSQRGGGQTHNKICKRKGCVRPKATEQGKTSDYCGRSCSIAGVFNIPVEECKFSSCDKHALVEWTGTQFPNKRTSNYMKNKCIKRHPTCSRGHADLWLAESGKKGVFQKLKDSVVGGVKYCREFFTTDDDMEICVPIQKSKTRQGGYRDLKKEFDDERKMNTKFPTRKQRSNSHDKKWTCLFCSFDNMSTRNKCEVCEKRRRTAPPPPYTKDLPKPPSLNGSLEENKNDGELCKSNIRAWNDFEMGDVIDVKDNKHKWYESIIRDVKADKIYVHFYGWADKWDEWIDVEKESDRLAKLGTYTKQEQNVSSSHTPAIPEEVVPEYEARRCAQNLIEELVSSDEDVPFDLTWRGLQRPLTPENDDRTELLRVKEELSQIQSKLLELESREKDRQVVDSCLAKFSPEKYGEMLKIKEKFQKEAKIDAQANELLPTPSGDVVVDDIIKQLRDDSQKSNRADKIVRALNLEQIEILERELKNTLQNLLKHTDPATKLLDVLPRRVHPWMEIDIVKSTTVNSGWLLFNTVSDAREETKQCDSQYEWDNIHNTMKNLEHDCSVVLPQLHFDDFLKNIKSLMDTNWKSRIKHRPCEIVMSMLGIIRRDFSHLTKNLEEMGKCLPQIDMERKEYVDEKQELKNFMDRRKIRDAYQAKKEFLSSAIKRLCIAKESLHSLKTLRNDTNEVKSLSKFTTQMKKRNNIMSKKNYKYKCELLDELRNKRQNVASLKKEIQNDVDKLNAAKIRYNSNGGDEMKGHERSLKSFFVKKGKDEHDRLKRIFEERKEIRSSHNTIIPKIEENKRKIKDLSISCECLQKRILKCEALMKLISGYKEMFTDFMQVVANAASQKLKEFDIKIDEGDAFLTEFFLYGYRMAKTNVCNFEIRKRTLQKDLEREKYEFEDGIDYCDPEQFEESEDKIFALEKKIDARKKEINDLNLFLENLLAAVPEMNQIFEKRKLPDFRDTVKKETDKIEERAARKEREKFEHFFPSPQFQSIGERKDDYGNVPPLEKR